MVVLGKVIDAGASVEQEPNHDNRCKRAGDLCCAERLYSK
jgi:hypothetical protein